MEKNMFLFRIDRPIKILGMGLELGTNDNLFFNGQLHNLYITNDEETKEWFILDGTNGNSYPMKYSRMFPKENFPNGYDKTRLKLLNVILTTDPELIADGVQAIPVEFLKWFVKHPTCESIAVEKNPDRYGHEWEYNIIIPQNKPKKEKLLRTYQYTIKNTETWRITDENIIVVAESKPKAKDMLNKIGYNIIKTSEIVELKEGIHIIQEAITE